MGRLNPVLFRACFIGGGSFLSELCSLAPAVNWYSVHGKVSCLLFHIGFTWTLVLVHGFMLSPMPAFLRASTWFGSTTQATWFSFSTPLPRLSLFHLPLSLSKMRYARDGYASLSGVGSEPVRVLHEFPLSAPLR